MAREDYWRVGTLNIWNRSAPWPERLALIKEELARLDLDAVALQEVLAFTGMPNQAEEIVAGTGWNAFYAPAMQIGPGLSMGNAVISRHALTDTEAIELPKDAGEPRSVAFAKVGVPHGPLPVFATHLVHQMHLGHVRCNHVKALAGIVAERAPIGGVPPVVMGDFNAEPDADEMRYLRGLTGLGGPYVYFADAWIAAMCEGPGYTYDRTNHYAARSREASRRIDYIYVRGPDRNLRGEVRSCELAWRNGSSDHFGVVAELHGAVRSSMGS